MIGFVGGISTCLLATAVTLLPLSANAQPFDPVTDRDFTIDLFQGPVLGSGKIIGMGGAAVATAEGAAGVVANPASPAVRPATSNDKWDWDWNIDWLNPELGDDFDNNGIETDEANIGKSGVITGGVIVNYKKWAFGVSAGVQSFQIVQGMEQFEPQAVIAHVVLARTFFRDTLSVGVGVRGGNFELRRIEGDARVKLISVTSAALEAGAVWMPADRDIRVGSSFALATVTNEEPASTCDPLDCEGFILPNNVQAPWKLSTGFAWRRAATRWNKKVPSRWRDERALVLAADIVVTGAVDNGYGLERYILAKELQPSGRTVNFSYRLGADYEWKPGWLRIRGGTYWEPGRFEEVGGRLHATVGLDVRIWSFCFWSERYRARLSLTGDVAEHYGNGAVSIGLWH